MNTYTTYYNLGKQEDLTDKFDMSVITDNADKIDAALHGLDEDITAVTPSTATTAITSASLETFLEGTIAGELDVDITGGAASMGGVVRAYKYSDTDAIQIAEAIDGTRVTRYYSSSTWSNWA